MTNNSNRAGYSASYTKKLSLSAGSLSALYVLPLTAQAAIIYQTTPVSNSVGGNPTSGVTVVDWDVDGNSTAEFNLTARASLAYTSGGFGAAFFDSSGGGTISIPSGKLEFNSATDAGITLGGRGLVQRGEANESTFSNLPLGFQVGSALSAAYQWGPSSLQNRTIGTTSDYSANIFQPFSGGGDEYIGFSFEGDNGQILYGWAEVDISDLSGINMTIERWAYDDSGASINVGQISSVPAPPALFTMLSGLALGAGGLLRGRRQRKIAESNTKTESA